MNREFLLNLLEEKNLPIAMAQLLDVAAWGLLFLILGWVLHHFSRLVIINFFHVFSKKTQSHFDDYLVQNRVPYFLAHLVPLYFLEEITPFWLKYFEKTQVIFLAALDVALVILILIILRRTLNSLRDSLKKLDTFKDKPIDSYIQVVMIVLWILGFVIIFSILTGKEITYFLTAMGALSAVLLLIFKDLILGFVASIQIAVNDLVRIGDWVTLEKFGADGDVVEINLSTVKIQNFDKTITSVPTYNFISDSFKNWRGMSESEGRRIKKAIFIRTSDIRFLTDEEVISLKNVALVRDYIVERQEEIQKHNREKKVDKSLTLNGRNMTNLGVFRRYIEAYLSDHPKINKNLTIMCRQLAPTTQGTPLEIYAFSAEKEWKKFEDISGDIFDHLLAAAKFFDLSCFEQVNGVINAK